MKKRIIGLLLCAVMIIGLLPVSALAAVANTINPGDTLESDGIWQDPATKYQYIYEVYQDIENDHSLYAELIGVTINSEATGIELTIPGTVPYTPVGESEQQIPLRVISGVNSNAIKSVSIPASVETIGANVFKNYSNLETVTFVGSSNLKTIGDSAFYYCHALKSCILPETVEMIGSKAFYFTSLTSVRFGAALTTLGTEAFAHCYSLAELDMSKATLLKEIPESCFAYHALTSLTIPNWVETIGDWAFAGNETMPGEGAQDLVSLNLGSGVQTIGQFAFYKNKGLTDTLTLPNSVRSIGKGAFGGCGYTDVKWPEGNGDFTEVNGFSACRSLTGAAIESLPLSVTTIGEEAFSDCINLGSVTIRASVRTIQEKAFYAAGITSLTISNGVRTIETNAFQNCAELLGTEITIPSSVNRLASGAFSELFTLNAEGKIDDSESLTVKVMNPDLILAEEEGDYQYFAADDTGHTNPSYTGDAFAGCVNLILYAPAGASTAKAYADKFNGVIIQATKENINFWYSPRTVEFRELTDVPVYHTVTLPDGGSDVTFTVKQDGKTLTPVSNGVFSAEHGKEVVVTAHREDYYDQVLVKQGADFTGDWTVKLGTWEALPVSGKLLVNITEDGLSLSSFDGLTLSLTEKVGNDDVPFTASYPYLVLPAEHGLSANTELTLTVTPDASVQLTGGSATSTLRDSSFTVALKGWGKAAVTATGTSAAPCVVILFDDAGNAVSSGTTSGGVFTSDSLPAGTYTAVAYETNDYFGAVGSKAAFFSLGLATNDYAKGSVTIADGSTKELTLTVPKLNTGNLTSVLDTKKCSLAFRSSRAVTGQAFDMRVNYALKMGSAQKITFTLPAGASIQSVYDEQGWLPVTDNSVTVNNASGTLYVSLVCTGTGAKSFGASVTTGGMTLPLGSGTVTVQNIFIEEADSYTAKRTGARVSVYTTPGASVTLTIPGAATVNGTANAAGRTTLTYSLPDGAVDGQSYILTVSANGGSARTSVTYLPASAELHWFGFRHYGYEITVIDHIHPESENTYYTYYALGNEASKYFSFSATIKADQNLKVTMTVTMQDGSVRSVPMTQIEETNGIRKYGGELYLEGNTADHVFYADSIPVGFGISWEDSAKLEFNGEAVYLKALQQAREQQEARESLLRPDGSTEDIKVDPFFGYAYRTVGTEQYYDCLMTEGEYDGILSEINQLEDSDAKTAFIELVNEIYSSVEDYTALAQAADELMDDTAEVITKVLQLVQPLQQYKSWDGVLNDMGVAASDSAPSATQLEGNDFTQVGSSWCKLGDDGGFTVAWPNGYDGGGQTQPPAGTGSGGQYSGNAMASASSLKEAEIGNWSDQVRAAGGHALGIGADLLEKRAKMNLAKNKSAWNVMRNTSVNERTQPIRDKLWKKMEARDAMINSDMDKVLVCKTLGVGLSLYNIKSDADQLNENIVKTAESEAKASELDVLIQYYTTHVAPAGCLSALQDEKKAYELLNDLMNQKSKHMMLNVGVGVVSLALSATTAGISSTAAMTYDAASGVAMYSRDVLIAETQKRIEQLHAARVAACGGEGWKKAPLRNLTPILDPSGIVYEAVESNILSGVTAKIYEVSGNETLWDAGAYDQTNPLTTGADGGYAWDVPTGTWQVKFTKDGYQDAATDPLTVPPPRMNLKTAMVSTAAPTVVSAAAYPDYVELVFSQYMCVTDPLTVPEGYTYEWVNKEKVNAESSTEYSKVLRLNKTAVVGDTVTVTLSGAKNYAGTALDDYSSGGLTVAVEPNEIRLNYETQIAVLVGGEKDPRVTVQVLDSSGQPLSGLTVTSAIEDTAYATITTVKGTTGEDGVAVFSVKGLLPGWSEATFAVEGSSLTKTMPVRVTIDSNQVAKPVASIGGDVYTTSTNSITVPRGSALTLTCATEDAVIYYTTNDTCPCQALDRQLYTGPITVNEDTYFRIAAYKDGMEYSERLNLKVSVSESSSGGGGGGYNPGYSVTVEQPENGSLTISPRSATKGEIVTITVVPDKGYTLETLTVTDKNGNELKLTEDNGKYTFTMPASKVTVKATFMEDNSMLNFFVDVPADTYYYDAVLWAAKNGITSGTSATTFSPDIDCTRAQIVTFLWRAAGAPTPKSSENPFTDLKADAYYYDAVLWAVEQGITSGTGDGKFSPEEVCTRSQSVTFLYRVAGSPKVSGNASFSDVTAGSYYADAVAWAEQNGITDGIGGGLFGSDNDCTRGQIVTLLYRFFVR